ncbi:conserved hypothetical protein [delta proteobacterium NaphS2]|nr:conserved hypothetical protein [delta proteobacterium NaphS2]
MVTRSSNPSVVIRPNLGPVLCKRVFMAMVVEYLTISMSPASCSIETFRREAASLNAFIKPTERSYEVVGVFIENVFSPVVTRQSVKVPPISISKLMPILTPLIRLPSISLLTCQRPIQCHALSGGPAPASRIPPSRHNPGSRILQIAPTQDHGQNCREHLLWDHKQFSDLCHKLNIHPCNSLWPISTPVHIYCSTITPFPNLYLNTL